MDKMVNATGEYPVGNYTVEATYGIYSASTSINMTDNKQLTLKLTGFVILELQSFILLPLFMLATLLATMIYRKRNA